MFSHTEASVGASKAEPRSTPLVLVVDDERPMQELLRTILRGSGLDTLEATSGAEALARATAESPDLVLMDLGLPDADGVDVTRRLREWMAAPILVVSARWQERDKVAVLDAGANDYVTKPFANGELLARIRVWLRQTVRTSPEESTIAVGELRIDFDRRLVHAAGREVHLTPIEYTLFAKLMRNAGRIVTYQQLLDATWGPRHATKIHYLRVYVAQLRRKLEPDGGLSRYLLTEPGVGYRITVRR